MEKYADRNGSFVCHVHCVFAGWKRLGAVQRGNVFATGGP